VIEWQGYWSSREAAAHSATGSVMIMYRAARTLSTRQVKWSALDLRRVIQSWTWSSWRSGAVVEAGGAALWRWLARSILQSHLAAPSLPSSWSPFRSRLAAATVALPAGRRRHFLPTSSGAFAALREGARGWEAARSVRASQTCASGYAPRAVAPPLRGAPSLARSRDFARRPVNS